MGWFADMFGPRDDNNKDKDDHKNEGREVDEKTLKLRKEELDIAKNRVDIGKVEVGKEIIEEQQTVNVPVTHEEVIIERKTINEPSDQPIEARDDEHFSLSVGEEKVDVGKHTMVTGEITARKRAVEENRDITETVRHEEARINKEGGANIVDSQLSSSADDQLSPMPEPEASEDTDQLG